MNYNLRFLSFFLLFTKLTFGQNPYYQTVDKSSGLTSNSVYDVFQDINGFMWFATGKGICRYDGNVVKTYTADFQTSKSGSCIQEDKYGRIWYENFDGFIYYIEKEKLNQLQQSKPIGYFRYGIIGDHFLLLQADGIQYYDLKTLKKTKKVTLNFNILKFTFAVDDKLYVFDEKLYEIDEKGNVSSHQLPVDFNKEFNSPIVQKTENGIIVISKYANSYCYFEKGKFSKKQFDFPTEFIQNIATTKEYVWLCTTKGIVQFDIKTSKSKTYFNDKNISFIYCDKQKNYWISTINEGVYFIENFDTKIIELPSKPTVLSKKENNLLVGTENDMLFEVNSKDYSNSLLYKGNVNHGVNQLLFDEKSKNTFLTSSKFKVVNTKKITELSLGAIKDVVKIDEKYFSFAASNVSGIFTFDTKLKSEWDFTLNNFKTFETNNVVNIGLITYSNGKSTAYNSQNKTIYYATNNGLIAFDKKGKHEIKFRNSTVYLPKIYHFNGNIYGYSSNEKVYKINAQNEIGLYILPKLIAKEKIEKIAIENQFLFAFTANAIYEINLENNDFKKVITLTKDIDISDVSLLNNQIYFASSKGIIVKNKAPDKATISPKLFIDGMIINDEKEVSGKNIVLKYNENNIKINFTVLSFVPNEKHEVLYNINNSKWNKFNPENRNLILSSLSPNDYEIKFKIDVENTVIIEKINFTIKNPFWKQWWFLALISLFLIYGIHLFYKKQILKIQTRNRKKLEKIELENSLSQAKIKAIKSQMNPHFFYNALNTLQSYILSNDKKSAINYLSKFSNLTRTILEMTEKETISISEEIKTLNLYLEIEQARFENDFEFEISAEKTIDIEQTKIPTMLLQPYVENAVKHGLLHKEKLKKLQILFVENEDYIVITIDDNGIGRKKSTELNSIKNKNHISFSTQAIQHKIELLNKNKNTKISITYIDKIGPNNQSMGTTVMIKLPK